MRRDGRLARALRACSSIVSSPSRSASATMSRTSPSDARRPSSTSTMAVRFSAQMSGQMPGWPDAMRVMSRKPPAASRSRARCSVDRSSARRIREAAARCGTCETTATNPSWWSGASAITSAPRPVMTDRSRAKDVSSVVPVGVSTQTAPAKRSGSAPSIPSCSEPAMGWPPMKRGSSTASTIDALTLPTSVTIPGPAANAARATSATARTGVARNVISAVGSPPIASSAPSSRARAAVASSRSCPLTCQPWRRSASPMDPPISPVPTTAARRVTTTPADRLVG